MTNADFYAFCRDQRKVESDLDRRAALTAIYNYMRECVVTKQGVTSYLEHCIQECAKAGNSPAAYQWIGQQFAGTAMPQLRLPDYIVRELQAAGYQQDAQGNFSRVEATDNQ
jgi:hypothetical protein